jgi:hypothetical protein
VFYNLQKKINLTRFNNATREIRRRAFVEIDPSSRFVLTTMLCDTDVNMYLLALSSFCRFERPKGIVVVSDNLSPENQGALKRCVPDIEIRPIDEVRSSALPTGGCWERLTSIVSQNSEDYVIQLDADTLTLAPPLEVMAAVNKNECFTLVSTEDCRMMTFKEVSDYVQGWQYSGPQVSAEKAFKGCRDASERRYVRGCAAFTGFAKNSTKMEQLESFSDEMIGQLGTVKWSEWGSEQVASNYLVASAPACHLLPFEKYPYYSPDMSIDEKAISLYHFIGTHRFKKRKYQSLARAVIESLAPR